MKKINFKSVSSTLSQKEMKNVLGGSFGTCSGIGVCDGFCFDPMHSCIMTFGDSSLRCTCQDLSDF